MCPMYLMGMGEEQPELFGSKGKIENTVVSSEKKKKIFLVDANSLIHRAFHALPLTLVNTRGIVVNAAYGFTGMLIKLVREFKPDLIVAAFDSKAPTFRHKIYEEYKAHRPEIAVELVNQFPMVKEILKAFKIPIIQIEGYEADDIIATYGKMALDAGHEVFIVSGDRDMLQLVDERIKVISTKKGISDIKIYDKEAIFERFGIYPEKIPDFLALKGEPSDNIPGIPGIGEKIASKLIAEFGSLENLYKNISSFEGKRLYDLLLKNKDMAFLAKSLATLSRKAPVDEKILDLAFEPDNARVAEVLTKYEFTSLLERMGLSAKYERVPEIKFLKESHSGDFFEVLKKFEKEKSGLLYIDEKLSSFTIATRDIFYSGKIQSNEFRKLKESLKKVLTDKFLLVTNDLKRLSLVTDDEILKESLLASSKAGRICDISLAIWLLDPERKDCSLESFFRIKEDKPFQSFGDVIDWASSLSGKLKSEEMFELYTQVELPVAILLAEMEAVGVPLDIKKFEELSREMESKIESESEEIFRLTGYTFNINSPQQLAHVLYDRLKLKKGKKRKQHYATDFATLLKLVDSHPAIIHILNYRELTKIKNSFVEVFLEKIDRKTGRIYCHFIQTGTATGRLASEDPNLQNIPLKGEYAEQLRKAIRPEKGNIFVGADYSQIDLRVMAHLSEERGLIEAFKHGEDIHTSTAIEVFGVKEEEITPELRRISKAINFGIIYGISPQGLSEQSGISYEEAVKYIEIYFQRYPSIKSYMEKTIKEAYENGYVKTILNRRRYLPGLHSSSISERRASERLALNSPIQGSAADIIKLAMLRFWRSVKNEGLNAKLILQVHDSLVVECEEEVADKIVKLLKDSMENAFSLNVPLAVKVSTGKSLADI